MFSWINKQGVASTDGFVLQRVHRFYFEYREGERMMKIVVEPGTSFSQMPTYESSFHQWTSPDGPASEADRERVKKNVIDAMAFMGSKCILMADSMVPL